MRKLYQHNALRRVELAESQVYAGSIVQGISLTEMKQNELDLTVCESLFYELLEDVLTYLITNDSVDFLNKKSSDALLLSDELVKELKFDDEYAAKLERLIEQCEAYRKRNTNDTFTSIINDFVDFIVNSFDIDDLENDVPRGKQTKEQIALIINDFNFLRDNITEKMQKRPGQVRKFLDWLKTIVLEQGVKLKANAKKRAKMPDKISFFQQQKQAYATLRQAFSPSEKMLSGRVNLEEDIS